MARELCCWLTPLARPIHFAGKIPLIAAWNEDKAKLQALGSVDAGECHAILDTFIIHLCPQAGLTAGWGPIPPAPELGSTLSAPTTPASCTSTGLAVQTQ